MAAHGAPVVRECHSVAVAQTMSPTRVGVLVQALVLNPSLFRRSTTIMNNWYFALERDNCRLSFIQ